jgi:shikimate kinase
VGFPTLITICIQISSSLILADILCLRQAQQAMLKAERIALVGFMGSGKSTIGRLLAKEIGYRIVDTDILIEKEAGKSITRVFQCEGEKSFRVRESRLLLNLSNHRQVVIATGGGVPIRHQNREFLRKYCRTFYLEVNAAEVISRLHHNRVRPLLPDSECGIESLLLVRRGWYEQVGDKIVTVGRSPSQIVSQICSVIEKG